MDGWHSDESKEPARLSISIHRKHVSYEMENSTENEIQSKQAQIYSWWHSSKWLITVGRFAANSTVDARV